MNEENDKNEPVSNTNKFNHGMTDERYNLLMGGLWEFGDPNNTKEIPQLTDDEIAQGWHFCYDWDGLLIHPECPEYDSCACLGQEKFKKELIKQKSKKALDDLAKLDQELGIE